MTENDALHIVRNPWGHSEQQKRLAALTCADLAEGYKSAYLNMKEFAEASGLNTVARAPSREHHGE